MPATQPSVFADPIATLPVKAGPSAKPASYFNGPKPGADVTAPPKAPAKAEPRIKVRAHTRAAPQKPVPLPPALNPAGDHRFDSPPKAAKPVAATQKAPSAPVNTQKLELATKHGESQRIYRPLYRGQKPSGFEAVGGRPGRAGIGSKVTSRPYWLATSGPTGDAASQLSSAQLVKAQKAGTHPTVAAKVLEGAVHPLTDLSQQATGEKPFKLGGAVSDVANIASTFVPAGKVGAAGILGLRGLKGLKTAKEGVTAIDAAKAIAPAAQEAAALRAAVSGQPARAALKGMTKADQVGAKLDNPLMGKSVRQLQKLQKEMYSQERAKRAAAAEVHLNNQALAPDERVRLAKNELKGELPKVHFQGFTELSDQAITAMQKHVLDHPHLMPFQKITASSALTHALTGKLPTPSELTLLEHVFGRDTANSLSGISKHPFKDTILSTLNVPRSLMASFDLSAPFRQGLVVATRHPQIFARNFKPMLKAFGSEKVYRATLDEIRARPSYPMMMQAKLSITDLGRDVGAREEQFASNIAEKIPVAGHGIRASGRAYTGFLDKTRADVFDHLIGQAHQQGLNVQDPKFLKSLGTYINSATGRGDLGHFQEAGKVLNTFLFSPRLLASRLNFLNPFYYKRLDPFARKEALRSAVQLAGTLSTLLTLASQVPGVKVVTDPRNPDWGKIRMGNTRIDIAGGFQQHLRLLAQLATGTAISSTTGKRLDLTAGGFGQPNKLDLFLRFFEGKESPIASFITDYMRNSNQIGTKFSLKSEAASRMIPLLAQDSYDLYKSKHGGMNGLAAAFGGYAVGSVGLGMQTYGAGPSKGKVKNPRSYFSSPSGGSGSPYFGPAPSSSARDYFGSP